MTPGLNPCLVCKTRNDPRQICLQSETSAAMPICWTCGEEYIKPLLLKVISEKQLEKLIALPKPQSSIEPAQLPANHPKVLQEKMNAQNKEEGV